MLNNFRIGVSRSSTLCKDGREGTGPLLLEVKRDETEDYLCNCGAVLQTMEHVVNSCPLHLLR